MTCYKSKKYWFYLSISLCLVGSSCRLSIVVQMYSENTRFNCVFVGTSIFTKASYSAHFLGSPLPSSNNNWLLLKRTPTNKSKNLQTFSAHGIENLDKKPWPNGFASRGKNRFACRLASSRKSQNGVHFTRIQMNYDQLVSTCFGWPNGEKLASICVRIWAWPKSTQVVGQTKRKSNASWKLELTCIELRVRLARALV